MAGTEPTTEKLLAGIKRWVEIESQTADVAGVNRMMDEVETAFLDVGADVQRIPGRDGRGDIISIDTGNSGSRSNTGILV
ncbi:MAG: M20 family peptidase, partial [Pseudomonadota bacterium]